MSTSRSPSNPILSIIVPAYNVSPYLSRCLDSLIHQTLRKIEIICVDDGSTDDTLKILHTYSAIDSRVHVLSHQTNQGVGSARNTGLKQVRAPYIAFVDPDDYVDLDAYEYLIDRISDQTDLVHFGTHVENTNPDQHDSFYERVLAIKKDGLYPFQPHEINSPNVWDKIFKTSIIREHSLSFPSVTGGEDNAFWFLYGLFVKNILFVPKQCYHYVRTETSYMGRLFQKKHSRSIIRAINTTAYIVHYLRKHRIFQQHRQLAFIYMLQRAATAHCHSLPQYHWKIYVLLSQYMFTLWIDSWFMIFKTLSYKRRMGQWPPLDSTALQ